MTYIEILAKLKNTGSYIVVDALERAVDAEANRLAEVNGKVSVKARKEALPQAQANYADTIGEFLAGTHKGGLTADLVLTHARAPLAWAIAEKLKPAAPVAEPAKKAA
jgi:hypothetical protein